MLLTQRKAKKLLKGHTGLSEKLCDTKIKAMRKFTDGKLEKVFSQDLDTLIGEINNPPVREPLQFPTRRTNQKKGDRIRAIGLPRREA